MEPVRTELGISGQKGGGNGGLGAHHLEHYLRDGETTRRAQHMSIQHPLDTAPA
jgi:hypothetical protein